MNPERCLGSTARPRAVALLASLAMSTLLVACATGAWSPAAVRPGAWSPAAVRPGDSRDDVLRTMGPPTATYRMPDGHARLEYNHMPSGRQTFMVDLDATGRVAGWQQVLDENHFAGVEPGMTRDDVLHLIGPPTYTWHYERPQPAITWLYRFETIQRCTLFEVSFDLTTGRVLSSAYPPDPACPEVRG